MAGKRRGRKPVPFGGRWTDIKLDVLAKYLRAYTTALKKQPFQKVYVDAFAGTGYRDPVRDRQGGQGSLLPEPAEEDDLLEGSARLALQVEPRFDKYIFIEKSPVRCRELAALRRDHPSKADDIDIVEGEANEVIRERCSQDWSSRRAVLFLDPFGMQVEWRTIEAIAETRAIDLWYLFPLAMGAVRLLDPAGDIPAAWRPALDRSLPEGWFDRLYRRVSERTLFDLGAKHARASPLGIADYVLEQLGLIFAGVASKPALLKNSRNSPLYRFCFAASNKNGAPVAVRIANALLKGLG